MKFCKKFEWTEDYDVVRKSRVTTLTQRGPLAEGARPHGKPRSGDGMEDRERFL